MSSATGHAQAQVPAVLLTAAQASTITRPPSTVPRSARGASVSRTCWGRKSGASSRSNATRPVTCAAANDEPVTKPHF